MPVRAMRNPTNTATCARAANSILSDSSGQSNARGTAQSLAMSIQAKMHVNALAMIAATRNEFSSGNRSAAIAADVAKSTLLRIINPLNKLRPVHAYGDIGSNTKITGSMGTR